ncbi:MAG TPA: hypothetical protein VM009_03225 [Terriglobales bacterium]|nr:hypothetical protein [Terriglobales bacterium]
MKQLRLVLAFLCLSVFTFAQSDDPKKLPPSQPSKGDSDKATSVPAPKQAEPAKDPKAKSGAEKRADAAKDAKKDEKPAEAKKDDAKKEDEKPKDPMNSGVFAGLKLRAIGPAVISGRVSSLAVNPKNRAQYYVGVASGGVWRTDNNGTTWSPVFESEGSYSIGVVVLDPKDSNIIWVGTGENNSQRSVGYGDGIYRSDDGGKSWKNMGLKKSEHIARILIDPRDSNIIYVAAQGPLWGPGGDRGLYKSTDGGKTWKQSLAISENTGVTDVVQDSSNPDVLYAAAYQRRRHVWSMINGGPESAIYKSTDAGATWNKLKSGLPTVEMGRIGLAISATDPNVVYATIEAADRRGGIYRTRDRGASWERRNDFDVTAMYYSTLYVDPKNVDRIYIMNTFNMVSDDGGRTLRRLGERSKHVDNHALWIDPNDTDYLLNGCDGGVYESYDRGATWNFKSNLNVGQFYDVTVDNSQPFYYVYGGTQDNSSLGGPSRTKNAYGIVNSDWFITNGGDGFRSQVDPEDPNIVYAESQYGGLVRYNRATGENLGIQPQEGKGEPGLKWNWDSPLLISPHSRTRLYFAANKLFQSDDRGNTWKAISPDLSRQIDRDKLPMMGKIWGPDAIAKHASTSSYGNIVALAESPKKAGLLYVGTDDGLIQVTENNGGSWRKIEKFPGVPDNTYVSRIAASNHEERTVYATFDGHKSADFKPYILKSTDSGNSWTSITTGLPENGPVLAIVEDHVNPKLLFAGTEFGLWFTVDGGNKWVQLKGGMPTIPVRDAVIHKREGDLVIATFGRGFYVLDDISPLRNFKPETLQQESALYAVRDTMMYVEATPNGSRGKGFLGESFFTAANPPYGATFTYFLKEKYKTAKEKRLDAEKAAAKKNEMGAYATLPYPTREQLRDEAEAEAPSLWFVISDDQGNLVRQISASNNAGMNRVTWNLRYSPTNLPPENAGGDDNPFDQGPGGTHAMPGKYSVKLVKKVDGKYADLSAPQSFNLFVFGADKMAAQDRATLYAFQRKVAKLDRAVSGAVSLSTELRNRVRSVRRALRETPANTSTLLDRSDDLDKRLSAELRALRGDTASIARQEVPFPPSLSGRVSNIIGDQFTSTALPTTTHQNDYAIVAEAFAQELAKVKALAEEVQSLEKEAEKLGAPWTTGRVPEWQDQ